MEQNEKRILFVIPEFSHGGTNKSLENLLSFLASEKFDIRIFCLGKKDYYYSVFNKYGVVSPSIVFCFLYRSLFGRLVSKILKSKIVYFNNIIFWLESLINQDLKRFDKIIAFQEGTATHFVSFLNGPKVAWVHCDYDLYIRCIGHNLDYERKIYNKYENVVCVSKYTSESFLKYFVDISAQLHYIYNVLNVKMIRAQSLDKVYDIPNDDSFKLLSIGRMDPVKQFHRIPQIFSEISKQLPHRKIKWYIIGPYSSYTDKILEQIKDYKLEDNVILLGGKDNPYPYFRLADLLVCTSSFEACPYVVNEAKILHVPVVSTNYPSAFELVDPSVGFITEIENMSCLLAQLISNQDGAYSELKRRCQDFEYNNDCIIEQVIKILV